MKKNILAQLLFILLLFPSVLIGQNTNKETFTYIVKDKIELKLDKYSPKSDSENTPCLIFMFGGGFVNGDRDSEKYINYFNTLTNNGITVISIDYRKGLESIKTSSMKQADDKDFVKLFNHTIEIATDDLIDVTAFILQNVKEWKIDSKRILVCGSSSGAIVALHGEYAIANKAEISKKLPEDFKYAGIISFAGALFSMHGKPVWNRPPAPMLLFHGNADKSVPYDAIELGYLGFYGSKFLCKQLDEMKVPYYFYDEFYAGHELANTPMQEHLDLILNFIDRVIIKREGLRVHINTEVNGREPVNTNFSVKDYILTNFSN